MSEYLLMVAYHVLSLWCCEVYGLILPVCYIRLFCTSLVILHLGAISYCCIAQ